MQGVLYNAFVVGAGGFAGSAARYLISEAIAGKCSGLPLATLTVNITGSLAIGILLGVLNRDMWYFLLVAGFCGGFTTFSAFSAEIFGMLKSGNTVMALLYAAASIALCIAAVWTGAFIATKFK